MFAQNVEMGVTNVTDEGMRRIGVETIPLGRQGELKELRLKGVHVCTISDGCLYTTGSVLLSMEGTAHGEEYGFRERHEHVRA